MERLYSSGLLTIMARIDINHTNLARVDDMKIGLVAYPGCMASGLLAFAELISAANLRAGKTHFEIVWVGENKEALPITLGASATPLFIQIEETLGHESLDLLVLPGFWSGGSLKVESHLAKQEAIIQALGKLQSTQPVWTYCTGACLLAASGKLDGNQATSTWWLANYLRQTYPSVTWRFNQTSILNQQHATASGVNGYLLFAQSLIESHCGVDVWRDITDVMVIARPDKTAQPFNQISMMNLNDKLMGQIFIWVENTAAIDLSLQSLAQGLNQSSRTLSRKIKAASGLSGAQFMRLIKLAQVGERLSYGEQSINVISHELGYSDDAALRRSFKKETGYTPGEFRQAFGR